MTIIIFKEEFKGNIDYIMIFCLKKGEQNKQKPWLLHKLVPGCTFQVFFLSALFDPGVLSQKHET